MKAFISYSHQDGPILDLLHKHLSQLSRDALIQTWTDEAIPAGGKLDDQIHSALNTSQVFIALLSPDYIASNYCYSKEFRQALDMQEKGNIIIVPVIIEPCEWLATPFNKFKALPKDGKPISTWENKNTALLDVIQNLRKLLEAGRQPDLSPRTSSILPQPAMKRNYRVQKNFDSIEKMEFSEQTFHTLKELLKRFMEEIVNMENIKVRTLVETKTELECLLVNRNKIATESRLSLTTGGGRNVFSIGRVDGQISYSISNLNHPGCNYILTFDEYHLYWREGNLFTGAGANKEVAVRDMADAIWSQWLESVGII